MTAITPYHYICPSPPDLDDANDDLSTSSMLADDEEPEEDEELQAVAKHFGKDLNEITLEALIKIEQKRTEDEGENQDQEDEEDASKRKAPSLAFLLGSMPSSATLGLSESISSCVRNEKENGKSKLFPQMYQPGLLLSLSFSFFHHQK